MNMVEDAWRMGSRGERFVRRVRYVGPGSTDSFQVIFLRGVTTDGPISFDSGNLALILGGERRMESSAVAITDPVMLQKLDRHRRCAKVSVMANVG